ncbi:probable serine/threonine-protein kinase yakA [Prorops nasuta]|uniref:probable serine/threonine-protein kinase yakA n=1 Tax=Prorops nasuta TaxID=863751 RepID=UPI0034CF0E8D
MVNLRVKLPMTNQPRRSRPKKLPSNENVGSLRKNQSSKALRNMGREEICVPKTRFTSQDRPHEARSSCLTRLKNFPAEKMKRLDDPLMFSPKRREPAQMRGDQTVPPSGEMCIIAPDRYIGHGDMSSNVMKMEQQNIPHNMPIDQSAAIPHQAHRPYVGNTPYESPCTKPMAHNQPTGNMQTMPISNEPHSEVSYPSTSDQNNSGESKNKAKTSYEKQPIGGKNSLIHRRTIEEKQKKENEGSENTDLTNAIQNEFDQSQLQTPQNQIPHAYNLPSDSQMKPQQAYLNAQRNIAQQHEMQQQQYNQGQHFNYYAQPNQDLTKLEMISPQNVVCNKVSDGNAANLMQQGYPPPNLNYYNQQNLVVPQNMGMQVKDGTPTMVPVNQTPMQPPAAVRQYEQYPNAPQNMTQGGETSQYAANHPYEAPLNYNNPQQVKNPKSPKRNKKRNTKNQSLRYTQEMVKDQTLLLAVMSEQLTSHEIMQRHYEALLNEQQKQLAYIEQMHSQGQHHPKNRKFQVKKKWHSTDEKPDWMTHLTPPRGSYKDFKNWQYKNQAKMEQHEKSKIQEQMAVQGVNNQQFNPQSVQPPYAQGQSEFVQQPNSQQVSYFNQQSAINPSMYHDLSAGQNPNYVQHQQQQNTYQQNQQQQNTYQQNQQQQNTYQQNQQQYNTYQQNQQQYNTYQQNQQQYYTYQQNQQQYNTYQQQQNKYPQNQQQQNTYPQNQQQHYTYPQYQQQQNTYLQNQQQQNIYQQNQQQPPNNQSQSQQQFNEQNESKQFKSKKEEESPIFDIDYFKASSSGEPSSLLKLRVYKEMVLPQKRNNGLQDPEILHNVIDIMKCLEKKESPEYLVNSTQENPNLQLNETQDHQEIENILPPNIEIDLAAQNQKQMSANGLGNSRNTNNPPAQRSAHLKNGQQKLAAEYPLQKTNVARYNMTHESENDSVALTAQANRPAEPASNTTSSNQCEQISINPGNQTMNNSNLPSSSSDPTHSQQYEEYQQYIQNQRSLSNNDQGDNNVILKNQINMTKHSNPAQGDSSEAVNEINPPQQSTEPRSATVPFPEMIQPMDSVCSPDDIYEIKIIGGCKFHARKPKYLPKQQYILPSAMMPHRYMMQPAMA